MLLTYNGILLQNLNTLLKYSSWSHFCEFFLFFVFFVLCFSKTEIRKLFIGRFQPPSLPPLCLTVKTISSSADKANSLSLFVAFYRTLISILKDDTAEKCTIFFSKLVHWIFFQWSVFLNILQLLFEESNEILTFKFLLLAFMQNLDFEISNGLTIKLSRWQSATNREKSHLGNPRNLRSHTFPKPKQSIARIANAVQCHS